MEFMEYLHIYLLVAAGISSIFMIFITLVMNKKTVLDNENKTFIDEYLEKTQHDLERSRIGISLQEYLLLKIGCPAVLAVFAYFVTPQRSMMLVLIIFGIFIPDIILKLKKSAEDNKFEDRFVRALVQMASALHSGMTVEQSVDYVINCELLHDNIREDFRILSSRLKLGISISDAFKEFAMITDSKDAADVSTAITIMTETGGDAGVAIEKIQKNIEDRLLYRQKRASMLTESNLIAIAADVMPILIFAAMYIFMPDIMGAYFEDSTLTVVFFVIIAVMVFGSIIIHKMLGNRIDAS